jgi:hypothetical protein
MFGGVNGYDVTCSYLLYVISEMMKTECNVIFSPDVSVFYFYMNGM